MSWSQGQHRTPVLASRLGSCLRRGPQAGLGLPVQAPVLRSLLLGLLQLLVHPGPGPVQDLLGCRSVGPFQSCIAPATSAA